MRPSDWVRRIEESIARRLSGGEDPHQRRIDRLRARGVSIGSGCWILSENVSTEPWLIEMAEREGRIKAHFGIDAPPAEFVKPIHRPLGTLR